MLISNYMSLNQRNPSHAGCRIYRQTRTLTAVLSWHENFRFRIFAKIYFRITVFVQKRLQLSSVCEANGTFLHKIFAGQEFCLIFVTAFIPTKTYARLQFFRKNGNLILVKFFAKIDMFWWFSRNRNVSKNSPKRIFIFREFSQNLTNLRDRLHFCEIGKRHSRFSPSEDRHTVDARTCRRQLTGSQLADVCTWIMKKRADEYTASSRDIYIL